MIIEEDDIPDDAEIAYLFACAADELLLAVTHDKTGANLPRDRCTSGWLMRLEFPLGVQQVMPVDMTPEPILRGILADGYFVWRDDNTNKAVGTSQ
jgi:hypothetical protein